MTDKLKEAENYFSSNFNCAQSTFLPFAEELQIPEIFVKQVASGFGGGMGRLQKTCGACTGAYMVIGAHVCRNYNDNAVRREKTYEMIQLFNSEFIKVNGSDQCSEIIQCDLKSEEGREKAINENKYNTVCKTCIMSAVEILEKLTQ